MAEVVLHVTDTSGNEAKAVPVKLEPTAFLKAAAAFSRPKPGGQEYRNKKALPEVAAFSTVPALPADSGSEDGQSVRAPARRWSFNAPRTTALLNMEPNSPEPVTLKLHKLSYKTVDTMIREIYSDAETTQSTALDILAAYLKGQKVLYTEAKTVCEQRLYRLMLPAILVTALCSVLSLQLKDSTYGAVIVSGLNGFNSFLLALISFLKLDAKAEAHKTSAYKYDKLQAFCEFKSGSILFLDESGNNVASIIKEIESNVKDIKETNQFLLPEKIRYSYPKLYSTNIFSHVKSIQIEEMILINKLKGVINALITMNSSHADERGILAKEREQNELLDKIINIRNKYLEIDSAFNKEINDQIAESKKKWSCLNWTKA